MTWTDWPRRSQRPAGCGSGSVTYQPASIVLERAIACARQSGNHRAQMRASHWLAVTFSRLPIPADAAVARTEQLLAGGQRRPVGRSGPAQAALRAVCPCRTCPPTPARPSTAASRYSPASARNSPWPKAPSRPPSSGLIIGDPAAAERYARQGCEAFRAMGERGEYVASLAVLLANALYEQGRFDEAQQLIDQANAEPSSGGSQPVADRGEAARPPRPVRGGPPASRPGSGAAARTESISAGRCAEDQGRGRAARRRARPGRGQPARRPANLRGPAGNDSGRARSRAALASLAAQPGGDPA